MKKFQLLFVLLSLQLSAFADIKVSDVQVFSGYPWKKVVVRYTITGSDDKVDAIRVTATDMSANRSYTVATGSSVLTGAEITEGRHTLRWNAAAGGAKFSSTNVVFTVTAVSLDYVQLWENGPYWAKCNVGASKPEEYGYYFSWGDTVGCKREPTEGYWVSVKDGTSFCFAEYGNPTYVKEISDLQSGGYIDSSGNLVAAHDAATVHLGAPWRMPTDAEFSALNSNCDTVWTTRGGVVGRLVTGRGSYSSKSIFLTAADRGNGSYLDGFGYAGCYWSSTPHSVGNSVAWGLWFRSSEFDRYCKNYYRYYGQSVRPLRGFAE